MKTKSTLAESAKNVDSAHNKAVNSRKNLAAKHKLYLAAVKANKDCESNLAQAKKDHDQLLTEKF